MIPVSWRAAFDGLLSVAIVVPGVVIGIATLVALAECFSFLNPALAAVWLGNDPAKAWTSAWLDLRGAWIVHHG